MPEKFPFPPFATTTNCGNIEIINDSGEETFSPFTGIREYAKAPNTGPGALANLLLSLVLTRSSLKDLFSDLSTTP
jgi:hypothetical protein